MCILLSPTDLALLLRSEVIGRDDRIWTCDILYPKQTRYQAALHPFLSIGLQCHCRESLFCFPYISSLLYSYKQTNLCYHFVFFLLFGLISYKIIRKQNNEKDLCTILCTYKETSKFPKNFVNAGAEDVVSFSFLKKKVIVVHFQFELCYGFRIQNKSKWSGP